METQTDRETYICIRFVPGHALGCLSQAKRKERKVNAHVSNMFILTVLVDVQYFFIISNFNSLKGLYLLSN